MPDGKLRVVAMGVVALVWLSLPAAAFAWVYPEHRDIAVGAVQQLDPERRAVFDRLWRDARIAHEMRLCEQGADAKQGVKPACIDWAALSAIAGDHSCSSKDMTAVVLQSNWILSVADVAARLKEDLSQIDVLPPPQQGPGGKDAIEDIRRRMQSETARAARLNALRSADLRLQRADPQYVSRAGSNNAHFLLPRPSTGMTPRTTRRSRFGLAPKSARSGSTPGITSAPWRRPRGSPTSSSRRTCAEALTRAMLFDEAFALHFLEDAFSAGHVAGAWGDASQRQGTHDLYNAAGFEAFPWKGSSESMVLMGDAHMRPEDLDRAAGAVRTSLEQLLDTAAGRSRAANLPHVPAALPDPDSFDVCKNNRLLERPEALPGPRQVYRDPYIADLREVLLPTPVPGLGPGLGAMPRSRSEVGPFVGLAGSADGRWINGGFGASAGSGIIAGVELAARVGLGLEGVMGDAGDGLVFFSLGLRGDFASTNSVSDSELASQAGSLAAAIPSRAGVTARLRMPFYSDTRRPPVPRPALLDRARTLPRNSRHRQQWRIDPVAVRPGDRDRPLPVRAGARARRHVLRADRRGPRVSTRDPGSPCPRGRLQVDRVRSAHRGVPSVPGVREQSELEPALSSSSPGSTFLTRPRS